MDQSTWEQQLAAVQNTYRTTHPGSDLVAVAGQVGSPLIVLVHGIGGNAQHWSDPASLNPNETWLFDLAGTPVVQAAAGTHITQSPPYAAGSVTSWTQVLSNQHISYVNWSQSLPNDLLVHAVDELVAVLTAVEQQVFSVYQQSEGPTALVPPLILLCHSRGGLVARAALKQLGSAGVPHLKQVITLSTPHHGSYMPQISADFDSSLHSLLDLTGLLSPLPLVVRTAVQPFLTPLTALVRNALVNGPATAGNGPGFPELLPTSATLQQLAQNEQPLPGVHYAGFGGSNPTFVWFFLALFGKAYPILPTAGAFLVERLAAIPGVSTRYGGLSELAQGDSAVGLASSHWPDAFGATHQDFHVNHMQALIEPTLQQALLQLLVR